MGEVSADRYDTSDVFVWSQWREHHVTLAIFILLCLNVVIAPAIYTVSNSIFKFRSDWVKELKLKIKF
ncbi:MAG: hypothetical protein V7K38_10160 [Nostoc sp.]|uniref:hypothetical protein n=1 Tax=Nostoc sp. TaxID=1180 RepID=UPI002FFACC2D